MVKRRLTDAQEASIPKLRELGLPFREIGDMFGVSDATIYYRIYPEKRKASRDKYLAHKALMMTVEGREQEAAKIKEAYERWKLASGAEDDARG